MNGGIPKARFRRVEDGAHRPTRRCLFVSCIGPRALRQRRYYGAQIRTCGFPASGSPTGFGGRPTAHPAGRTFTDPLVPSGTAESLLEVLGNMATLRTLGPFHNTPEVRPLPSTGITRLRRCRVGGGALGCPHAGLRPPLKRSVQFSCTPLSPRYATSAGGSKVFLSGPSAPRLD